MIYIYIYKTITLHYV